MILNYEEYKKVNPSYAKYISRFNKVESFLHEIAPEEINKVLKTNGSSYYVYKSAIKDYLVWLNKNYNIDTTMLYMAIDVLKRQDEMIGQTNFFYSYKDLEKRLDHHIEQLKASNLSKDYVMVKCVQVLNWYGITDDEIPSIKITNVKDKEIYIPLTNRTVKITDDDAWNYIQEAIKSEGIEQPRKNKIALSYYKQNTLIRTIKNKEVNKTSINRLKTYLDKDFLYNNVYLSGFYTRTMEQELASNKELTVIEFSEIAKDIVGANFTEYMLFKRNS